MNWIKLDNISQLDTIAELSKNEVILIFKHSTRCSISSMALSRLEREWNDDLSIKTYYLDLIAHRDISNQIAEKFNVAHESPQAILVNNGSVVYNASHNSIRVQEISSLV